MEIINSPIALIMFSISFAIAVYCRKSAKRYVLSFIGGIILSIGIIISLIIGATMQEILIVLLIILTVSINYNRSERKKNDEF